MVEDPEPQGARNPWRTYLACLRLGAELSEPFVILQDDCLPCEGFLTAAAEVRRALPDALITFTLQRTAQQAARTAFYQALERGERLIRFYPRNWVPALALGWTPELARRALEWDATQTRLRESYNSDDGRLLYFTRWAEAEMWLTVPCLVDHPDDVRAVGEQHGGKGRRRVLTLFEGDASSVRWAAEVGLPK